MQLAKKGLYIAKEISMVKSERRTWNLSKKITSLQKLQGKIYNKKLHLDIQKSKENILDLTDYIHCLMEVMEDIFSTWNSEIT
jgi:hypothetical protein